jgi:hypothetical protein
MSSIIFVISKNSALLMPWQLGSRGLPALEGWAWFEGHEHTGPAIAFVAGKPRETKVNTSATPY